MVVFESTRVADLVTELDGIMDEFGYQGITDTERNIATLIAVLCQAVRDGRVETLAKAAMTWEATWTELPLASGELATQEGAENETHNT